MSKELENILKKKFEQFEVQPSTELFNSIVAKRTKKRTAAWIRWMKWSAAAVVLISLMWWGSCLLDSEPESQALLTTEVQSESPELHSSQRALAEDGQSVENTEETEASVSDQQAVTVPQEMQKPSQGMHDAASEPETQQTIDPLTSTEGDGMVEAKDPLNTDALESDVVDAPEPPQELVSGADGNELPVVEDAVDADAVDETLAEAPTLTEGEFEAGEGEEKPVYKEKKLPMPWSVELTVGPGYAFRSIYGPTEFVAYRNNTEMPSVSIQSNLNVIYRLSPEWNVMTGVNFTRRNEIFDFTTQKYTYDTSVVKRQIEVYDQMGNPYVIEVEDTSVRSTAHTTKFNSRNNYTSWSIPLAIERTSYYRNRWSIMTKVGVNFSVHSQRSGNMRIGLSEVIALDEIELQHKGQVTAIIGLGAAYRVNKKLQFVVYPQLNFDLNSSLGANNVSTKSFGAYTHLGLRLDL